MNVTKNVTRMPVTTGRTLHLVDLENLLGDRRKDPVAQRGLSAYLDTAAWSPGDHVYVASDHEIIKQIGFDRRVPCNVHAVRGDDAADTVLLSMAPAELICRRYSRLVIGSGDAIFLRRALDVRSRGIGVLIVSRADGVARGFAEHGFPIRDFDSDGLDTPLTAAA